MTKLTSIHLKPGREKPVRHRHPWVFSGAIARVDGVAAPGDIVRVLAANSEFLAYGYWNPHSQISLRLLTWEENERIDSEWWARMIQASISRRSMLLSSSDTDSCRLIYSEADGLPGLIVDRYSGYLVCQFLTAGIERVREIVLDLLEQTMQPPGIFDLSDNDARLLEGLSESSGLVRGREAEGPVSIRENRFLYLVDLGAGQKTGFYLDQRDNRRRAASYAAGLHVLDCFCYTGGFTIPVLAATPQSVTCIDSSAPALAVLQANLGAQKPPCPVEILNANVFEALRKFRDQGRQFDMVILDPPKLAASQSQVSRAMRAYKDLNLLAMKLLTPNGILATFSCSGAVSRLAFQEAVAWAATDAGRAVQILEYLSQGADHPILLSFPESEYLKGMISRVL
jgi:23S rRNA (cytosine1962-C5)-methyltransferase